MTALLRLLAGLLLVAALAGCGEVAEEKAPQDAARASDLQPAPPIEAIDEPAPEWATPRDRPGADAMVVYIAQRGEGKQRAVTCSGGADEPAECAEFREEERRWQEAIAPARGVEPRAVARLRAGEAAVKLVAWPNREGRLCTATVTSAGSSGGGGVVGGRCTPSEACRDLCLAASGSGSGPEVRSFLAGTVASRADELEIEWRDGAGSRYSLTGPLVPDFPSRRVFLAEMRRPYYRALRLFSAGRLIAEKSVPEDQLRAQECLERAPPLEREPEEHQRAYRECVAAGK